MTPEKGNTYPPQSLVFEGWTAGDGTGTEGYNAADYFTSDGVYLGPDTHGIEPTFRDLPPDPDEQNSRRAAWARAAVDAFVAETGVDLEDGLCDLLCDLMHLADRENWDFDHELERARGHYEAETEPEEEQ